MNEISIIYQIGEGNMTKVLKLKFYVISLFLISIGLTQVTNQQFSQEQRDELKQNLQLPNSIR